MPLTIYNSLHEVMNDCLHQFVSLCHDPDAEMETMASILLNKILQLTQGKNGYIACAEDNDCNINGDRPQSPIRESNWTRSAVAKISESQLMSSRPRGNSMTNGNNGSSGNNAMKYIAITGMNDQIKLHDVVVYYPNQTFFTPVSLRSKWMFVPLYFKNNI